MIAIGQFTDEQFEGHAPALLQRELSPDGTCPVLGLASIPAA
jgi:hypothetical protein